MSVSTLLIQCIATGRLKCWFALHLWAESCSRNLRTSQECLKRCLSDEAPHLGCGSQILQELTHYEHVVCIQKPKVVETSLLVKVQQGRMDLESQWISQSHTWVLPLHGARVNNIWDDRWDPLSPRYVSQKFKLMTMPVPWQLILCIS